MPGGSALPTGVQAAGAYLRELLLRPGRFRRKWEQYAERSRAGQVNRLAVAEVLAHYLWEHPRAEGDADVLPRQLKDTAARALSGKLLTRATLFLFMDAFALDPPERAQLLKLWEGSVHVRVLSGRGPSVKIRPAGSAAGGSRRSPCTTTITWAQTDGRRGTALFT